VPTTSTIPQALVRVGVVLGAAAIAVAIFVIGRSITPDYSGTALFGRTAVDTVPLKSWLATGVLALAGVQLTLGLWMYGRLPGLGVAPGRVGLVHRLTGVALVLLTLPIAYHCMLAYGVQTPDSRVAVHSIAGSAFYGAFVAKVGVVRSSRFPGWALPAAGALLVTIVVVLWYSSALWYFNDYSVPLLH